MEIKTLTYEELAIKLVNNIKKVDIKLDEIQEQIKQLHKLLYGKDTEQLKLPL